MSLIKIIPEDHIEELEKEQHEKFHKMLDAQTESKSKSWEIKEQWLSVFERSLSPTIACKQAGVPNGTYRRWRASDPRFCRALNQIIADAHDELIGTAYARATGYLKPSEETETGYEEDATGRPIRHGVSDRLAISLVSANQKAQDVSAPVVINVNFAALGVGQDKLEQLPSNVVDAECVPVAPDTTTDE